MIGLAIIEHLLEKYADAETSAGTYVVFLLVFIPVYYRLENIGMNPWCCLLMLAPPVNLLVGIRCLAFQEGYVDSKKLDTAGKVIAIVLWLFIFGFILMKW